ncbi:tetratricopeptide repeat protein [Candidatus Riflebacteria bacterium]
MKFHNQILLLFILCLTLELRAGDDNGFFKHFNSAENLNKIEILYPFNGTIFPPDLAVPPTFRWKDENVGVEKWKFTYFAPTGIRRKTFSLTEKKFLLPFELWEKIRAETTEKKGGFLIEGFKDGVLKSRAGITFSTAKDGVEAPIFYREVNLPFKKAVTDPSKLVWRFGSISSCNKPPIVLKDLPVCGNCHSFSNDGKTLGLDVDHGNDKGGYAVVTVKEKIILDKSVVMTWSDYKREDKTPTFGLLSRVSPTGRFIISTVKDRSVFLMMDELAFSQLFFPIQGILAVYDRETGKITSLPGADDPSFVQSDPAFSPDEKYVVFARAPAYKLKGLKDTKKVIIDKEEAIEFYTRKKKFKFDVYRIPFNQGQGGKPEPLPGASNNGKSNYFARYSPDGKWMVFCQAESFMLLSPSSKLYIIPVSGGKARLLECNTRLMNSWHSWSPNSRWLVFSSKVFTPYTQLFLAQINRDGESAPPVLLEHFTSSGLAANIPEFVNNSANSIQKIIPDFLDDVSFKRVGDAFRSGHEMEHALKAYEKALKLNLNNLEVINETGFLFYQKGEFEKAEGFFRRAIDLNPQYALAHSNLGSALAAGRKWEEAKRSFRTALAIEPENFKAANNLGMLLFHAGDLKGSFNHLKKAMALDPEAPEPKFYFGWAFLKAGKPVEGFHLLKKALELARKKGDKFLEKKILKELELGRIKYGQKN